MSDIKNLLDGIINDTNNSFREDDTEEEHEVVKFDRSSFREELSMFVLKDIVHAMMHDEVDNLDSMIDQSINKHLSQEFNGSAYDYLKSSRDELDSPTVASIIQEIDAKVLEVENTVSDTKDGEAVDAETETKDLLKNVDSYDDLRARIKDKVSKQVVDDVAKVITTGNDAPVFDDIDDKLESNNDSEEDVTQESVILSVSGEIVMEHYKETGETMDTETGLNLAIMEYCYNEMDKLFGVKPKHNFYAKYKF